MEDGGWGMAFGMWGLGDRRVRDWRLGDGVVCVVAVWVWRERWGWGWGCGRYFLFYAYRDENFTLLEQFCELNATKRLRGIAPGEKKSSKRNLDFFGNPLRDKLKSMRFIRQQREGCKSLLRPVRGAWVPWAEMTRTPPVRSCVKLDWALL